MLEKAPESAQLLLSVAPPVERGVRYRWEEPGGRYRFEVERSATVGQLRKQLEQVSDFRIYSYNPHKQQRLAIFSGDTELDDNERTLESYGVHHNTALRTERVAAPSTSTPPPIPSPMQLLALSQVDFGHAAMQDNIDPFAQAHSPYHQPESHTHPDDSDESHSDAASAADHEATDEPQPHDIDLDFE